MRLGWIDGDLAVYKFLWANEVDVEWTPGLVSAWVQMEDVYHQCSQWTSGLCEKLNLDAVHICLSHKENFRKELHPDYKANRENPFSRRKPIGFHKLVQWFKDTYPTHTLPKVEADDVMGIYATKHQEEGGYSVVISEDKDLLGVATDVYNPTKDSLTTVTPEAAFRFHMHQTLTGDRVDNYFGLNGIGPKRADKILEDGGVSWRTVRGAYKKAQNPGSSSALTQARLAKILDNSLWDWDKMEPILWTP